jgi:hypothetical protein
MARALSKITAPKKKKEQKVQIKHVKPKAAKGNELKPYVFVTGETKYVGNEPVWEQQPAEKERFSKLARAFTWYTYFFKEKEAKSMLVQWLEQRRSRDEAKAIKAIHENEFNQTMCWLSRMNLMGLVLQESEQARLDAEIARLHSLREPVVDIAAKASRPNIQDNIRKKALDTAGELEGIYDDWVRAGAKGDYTSPVDFLRSQNFVPAQISVIQEAWSRELAELKAVQTDKDVAECYSAYTKIQIRNMIKFCEQVLSDCASYIQVKKVERKPRAKKAKTPAQLVKRFRYLKEFADLKLKSESPEKLVAANEAWLYNAKARKLIHVVADSNAGSLTVNGMSVVGFDEKSTVMKTLRRPAEQLKEIFAGGKPATRKAFAEVKATEAKWNGRSNPDLIILKVW